MTTVAKPKIALELVAALLVSIPVIRHTETVDTEILFFTVSLPRALLFALLSAAGIIVGLLTARAPSGKPNGSELISLGKSSRVSGWLAVMLVLVLAGAPTISCITDHKVKTEMEANHHIHHSIDYIEFNVTDLAEAKRFYAAAFGWEFNDYGPEYAGIRKGDGEAGGLRQVAEATRGGSLVILYSDDLGKSLQRVQAAGGRIVREPFEFPGGRRFHFLDPSGNELGVWAEQ